MLSPAVLFIAITIIFPISEIYCNPDLLQEIDIQSLLELVQQQSVNQDKDDRYETDFREEETKHYGSLKSQEILELIQKATQNKEWQNIRNDNDFVERNKDSINKNRNRHNTDKGRYYLDLYKELNKNNLNDGLLYGYKSNTKNKDKYKDDDDYKDSRYNREALEQLLSQNVLDKKYQGKPRYRLIPNNLVGSSESKNDRAEDRNNLGTYSKVYVILNPKAIEKSANKDKLSNLLAKVLSLTSLSYGLGQEKKNRESRYKGFSVLPGLLSRRARRYSREMYGKDSIEEDFKPKRPRSERGGGGGSGAGRTAIPYIRHRGDIYERDN